MRTMGQKEQATIAAGFDRVSIFRPGLLNRQTGKDVFETVQDAFGLGLQVETLAAAMIRDAETTEAAAGKAGLLHYQGNALITQTAKL